MLGTFWGSNAQKSEIFSTPNAKAFVRIGACNFVACQKTPDEAGRVGIFFTLKCGVLNPRRFSIKSEVEYNHELKERVIFLYALCTQEVLLQVLEQHLLQLEGLL